MSNPLYRASAKALACLLGALVLPAGVTLAEITPAQQILIDRGLQLSNMSASGDVFHQSTYQATGYTTEAWEFSVNMDQLGDMPWSRWVPNASEMPGGPNHPDETPYLNQLVSLELGDELNLNDPTIFANEVSWFNSVKSQFPNTLLYTNNYSGQISDTTLGNFITQAHPDMIAFDAYPWKSVYSAGKGSNPNNTTDYPAIGGVPTNWLSELRRYRQFGIGDNVPVATYTQTFHAIEDYDSTVYRDPSESELRYNNTAALAFNVKSLIGFQYNASSSMSLFTGPGGDTHPNDGSPGTNNSLWTAQQDINRRNRNLGRALVQLKPVYDIHNAADTNPPPGPASIYSFFPDGTTTSILILKSNPGASTGGLPIGFQDHPGLPKSASWWEADANDPYFRGWSVTNLGTKNGGAAGQVMLSWFTPLDEKLDGPDANNEVYIMVTNGLTDPTGTAADCAQKITLNFLSSLKGVEMLDPETGILQKMSLPLVNSRSQLVLTLNGGDGALFKFDDGAPFVGFDNYNFVPEPAGLALFGAVAAFGLKRRPRRWHRHSCR